MATCIRAIYSRSVVGVVAATITTFMAFAQALAESPADDPELAHSEAQLADSVGLWAVTTEFLKPDGSVARAVEGTYEFVPVIPGRVVRGESHIPELDQTAAILFYVDTAEREIEMVSVAADGRLWVMTGPLGGEVRTTEPFETVDGGTGQLRFTRFNVAADSFESKMEYSDDGGQTWLPGNRQYFRRMASD